MSELRRVSGAQPRPAERPAQNVNKRVYADAPMETDRANLRLIRTGGLADPAAAAATHSTSRDRPARLDAVRLLSLDAHGRVLAWMRWQDATCLSPRGQGAGALGEPRTEERRVGKR